LSIVSNNLNPSISPGDVDYAVGIHIPMWWHQSVLQCMITFNVRTLVRNSQQIKHSMWYLTKTRTHSTTKWYYKGLLYISPMKQFWSTWTQFVNCSCNKRNCCNVKKKKFDEECVDFLTG
jgi:hypothetical protein